MKTVLLDGGTPWWRDDDALTRFVADLLGAELDALRPGRARAAATDMRTVDLVADCGADSLELMALTAALAEALQLNQAGMLDGLLADTRVTAWAGVAAAALGQAPPARLCFRTSGSAGAPKRCVHQLSTLAQEVAELADLFPGRRRVVSAVPSHHIYGFLFTVLLPRALAPPAGGALEVVDVRQRAAAGVWQALQPGDLMIGYPEFWRAALAGAGAASLPRDVIGVSSTAPCPDLLADDVLAAGLARLVQVYGSSETGGVGWRDAARAPYRRLPYWQRDGADAAVLLRSMADGTQAPYPLQDRLAWQDGDHFLPLGRIDAAVQVGGVNVSPSEVEKLLRSHPGVTEAAVRLMRPDEGTRLKAFIVAANQDSESSLTGQLDDWLRARLVPAARPASYTFGDALPRQRNGKLADWMIDT